uniref:FAD-binding domain-containing protein n=1 Tax=Tetraselmis chuii TaxID=63592 RepID=A0A7S1SI38_9CHLO|mmetsp:Transcript_11718/g.21132  ORF Transcript_11718/g.21132 Transcript_11718/m.21132 type:complete len:488 (+) Transcript_11718:180-1643(+)|eukprot:CAMPEP_0177765928 /NCGR_PEP_ID=MMETSP0491_2-20121128/8247_1 /TAXON_ID=63592 /ORGANISM="Tetraselmis chuii, Strain PLY429" /LENGTH=487 /DNA_ID=CAMNT_0019282297 /DNA_START=111 /DNA_END=1574 /DNA_ORIENTATION=+
MQANKTATVVGATAAVAAGGYLTYRLLSSRRPKVPKTGPWTQDTLPSDAYVAVVVGAGPSGSTAAFYLAKAGVKVALCEKEKFPRDKICGDALCTPSHPILQDMGVMQEMFEKGLARPADAGGFVSPSGLCYIGASKKKLGRAACFACKRLHIDEAMAKSAERQGADLMEEFEVTGASFDEKNGLWTVNAASGKSVKARMLVCCDGATSRLATSLGYCTEPPKGVCSRSYVEGGTHNTDFDGVCFYPRESLPGYCAIFRETGDDLNLCYYLIPQGEGEGQCGSVKESDLPRLHNDAIKYDPFISQALGPSAKVGRMRAASLRLGCQGIKSTYGDHIMICGDAAGHIDPVTGEGIHTGMMAAKAAAETICSMVDTGDFSAASCQPYYDKWMGAFGYDFGMSRAACRLMYKFPVLLDACANEMQVQGDAMMSKWAEVMTNMRPKSYFLRPDVGIPLGFATVRELVHQYILRRPTSYPSTQTVKASQGKK